jgi:hypothetical protein
MSAVDTQSVMADSTDSYSVVRILSPNNESYDSGFLTLNVTFSAAMGMRYWLTYEIDGNLKGSINWTITNPTETHIFHDAIGTAALPYLPNGSHSLTVCLLVSGFVEGQNPRYYYDTANFTVDSTYRTVPEPPQDSTPPRIS